MQNTILYYIYKLKRLVRSPQIQKGQWARFHELMNSGRIVVFDTETTGLDTSNDDIIQIAAIELVNGEIGESLEYFFATEKPLSPTQTIHNISNAHLKKKSVEKRKGLKRFVDFLGVDALLAHNIQFDYSIINSNLLRSGLDSIDKKNTPLFCTLSLSRELVKLPSYKLGRILKSLNIPGDNSHDALDDVKATINLALHLKKQIEDLHIIHEISG
jgi:DNA helicase II / ATP-dependent DNA helicase PcrA